MPRARPPRPYDPEIGARIVARIAAGEELRDLWRDPTLPGRYTLKRWRDEHPAFSRAVRAAVNAARSRVRLARSPYGAEARARVLEAVGWGLTWREIAVLPGVPHNWSIANWLKRDPDFRWDWAVAREMWADGQTEAARDIVAEAAADPATARRLTARLTRVIDQRRLPQKHNLFQIHIDREIARTGQCPCPECRNERAWARLRAEG